LVTALRVIHYGLGPIGLGIAEILLERGYRIVGAVDIDPSKSGRPLTDLLPGAPAELIVSPSFDRIAGTDADVVVHSTQSYLRQVNTQLGGLLAAGRNVISTCEELAYPWYHHPAEAAALDRLATAHGVSLVGTGINPGFVMDLLPLVMTAPCRHVARVTVTRIVDASQRRLPLQRKVGVGLTQEEFRSGVDSGRIAHVGLPESVAMVAAGLGWRVEQIDGTIDPVLGPNGAVRGLHQTCAGRVDGRVAILLDLTMAAGADSPRDEIDVDGTPPVHVTIPAGIHGDQATCAIVANTLPRVIAAPAGLLTAADLPPGQEGSR
jgi:hypothetical protein